MSDRERFLATMRYEPRDRPSLLNFGFWSETLVIWKKQGLPADIDSHAARARYFGMDATPGPPDVSLKNHRFYIARSREVWCSAH